MATNYKIISPKALIEKFELALNEKWGYIWGTSGQMWTVSRQQALDKTTDSNRAMGRKYGSKWIDHVVADCSGLFAWAFKQLESYMYHGSNTMWNKYCVDKGELKKGVRTDGKELKPGSAVFTHNLKTDVRGHVGLYIGNGWVIEAEGTIKGVVKSKITASKWVEWGELKYVDYGSTLETVVDKPVESDKPSAKTYPTIRYGSKGEYVTLAQTLLAKAGSTLSIDGIFGIGTQSAVYAFQKKHDLEVDGIVGPKTWKKLLEFESANMDPVKEKVPTKKLLTLRRGSKGEDVKTLQTLLAKDGSTLAIDGVFGIGTQSAVRAFQKKYGLEVDGVVGPKTWGKLFELYM